MHAQYKIHHCCYIYSLVPRPHLLFNFLHVTLKNGCGLGTRLADTLGDVAGQMTYRMVCKDFRYGWSLLLVNDNLSHVFYRGIRRDHLVKWSPVVGHWTCEGGGGGRMRGREGVVRERQREGGDKRYQHLILAITCIHMHISELTLKSGCGLGTRLQSCYKEAC